jgi:predicted pyridoxine 5'-phosphate oxidase superfamily flavin-nucleotide-binding protein
MSNLLDTGPPDTGNASPWHDGERAVRERVGGGDRLEEAGRRVIRSFMPDQHRLFFAQLPFLVVGSVDRDGWPWASMLFGPPGFATSPDPGRLDIAALPHDGDPLRAALAPGAPLAVLGIEAATRRRNRANGRVTALDATGFSLAVEQSFGNCAMYIQRRAPVGVAEAHAVRVEPFTDLDPDARRLIAWADTAFVASHAGTDPAGGGHGADVSHRGGLPGFIGLDAGGAIVIPDFAGNRFFNTLGNLLVNPRAGLLFVDFARGDLLQIAGRTEIVWDGPEVRAFKGAERLWRVRPEGGRWLRGGFPLCLELTERSPQLRDTGTWSDVQGAATRP